MVQTLQLAIVAPILFLIEGVLRSSSWLNSRFISKLHPGPLSFAILGMNFNDVLKTLKRT